MGAGAPFADWVKDSFTNHDLLHAGAIVCAACLFCFSDNNESLTRLTGNWWPDSEAALAANPERCAVWQRKAGGASLPASPAEIGLRCGWGGWTVPQKFRNYSHFVVKGQWLPLSKGDKTTMRTILCEQSPAVAIIADSGQKHLAFRAQAGWWQFEEHRLLPCPDLLAALLHPIESLYQAGASKAEIESGHYDQRTMRKIGVAAWQSAETQLKPRRGSLPFKLAIFLAQKGEDGN